MPVRLALLVAIAAAMACSNPECDVEDLVADDIRGVDAIECGVLDVGLELFTPELETAHDCVQQAFDSGAPFYVVWRYTGFEGWVTQAYVGRESDGAFALVLYSRSPDPGGNYGTGRSTCTGLVPRSPCDSGMLTSDLCFECVDRSSEVLCEIE